MKKEKRFLEIRFNSAEKGIIEGTAVKWNKPSLINGQFNEEFRKDSVKFSKRGVQFLYMHDDSQLLGNSLSDSFDVKSTDKGIEFRAKLPKTQLGEDVKTLLKEGAIRGASIGFIPIKEDRRQGNKRIIEEAELLEISLVGIPAHETSLSLRKEDNKEKKEEKRHWSDLLIEYKDV